MEGAVGAIGRYGRSSMGNREIWEEQKEYA